MRLGEVEALALVPTGFFFFFSHLFASQGGGSESRGCTYLWIGSVFPGSHFEGWRLHLSVLAQETAPGENCFLYFQLFLRNIYPGDDFGQIHLQASCVLSHTWAFRRCLCVLNCFSHTSLPHYGLQSSRLLSVHGILQARIPEWIAMPSSGGCSQPSG